MCHGVAGDTEVFNQNPKVCLRFVTLLKTSIFLSQLM